MCSAGTSRAGQRLDTAWIVRGGASHDLFHPSGGAGFVELPAKPGIPSIPAIDTAYLRRVSKDERARLSRRQEGVRLAERNRTSRPGTGAGAISLKTGAAAACLFVFLLIIGLSFYFLYQSPAMGVKASWNERSRAWEIVSASPPFLPGDVLVSIEGRRIGFHEWLTDNIYIQSRRELLDWFDAKRDLFALMSRPAPRVTLMREGRPVEVRPPIRPMRFSFLGKVEALHWIIGAAFFFVGLIVFWKKGFEVAPVRGRTAVVPQGTAVVPQGTAVVFFVMSAVMMLLFVTNATSMTCEAVYAPGYFILMNLINIGSTFFGAALMFHFSLLMPEKRGFLVRFSCLVPSYYILCAVVVAFLSFPVMNVAFPAFFALSLAAMGFHFLRSRDPIQRQQLKWVLAGFGSGLLPFVLINGIPMILTGQRLINDTIPGLFLILIPLFTAFAIQKFHLMEIDSLFDNTLVYGATFGLLAVVDFAVVGFFSRLLPDRSTAAGPMAGVLGLWFVVVSYVPLRNRMRHWVNRLLKREQYDSNEISARLSGRLILASDVAAALSEAARFLREALHPRGTCAFLFSEPAPTLVFNESWPDAPAAIPDRTRSLNGAAYLYSLLPEGEAASDYASGIVCPLNGQVRTIGCIALKNRISGKPYSRRDLSLLDMIGRQLSLALENISAKEAAQARERENREVKEHISREMHDGIGGTFSNAIMMLDLISGEHATAADRNRIGAMRDALTDGLAETRALIRTMEEKETALADLRESLEEKVRRLLNGKDVECLFETDIGNYDFQLSPLVVHNVIKIVQEAVTNALKHSQAGKISLAVREAGGELSVRVTDDGKGPGSGSRPIRETDGESPVGVFDDGEGLRHVSREPGHYGLRNMARRCREMGAELRFYSEAGRGLCVEVVLPPDPVSLKQGI